MYYYSRFLLGGLFLFILLNGFGLLAINPDISWLGLAAVTVSAWAILEGSNHYLKNLSITPMPPFSWLAITAVVYINALGCVFYLYGRYYWYDRFAHIIGGIAVALFLFFLLRNFLSYRRIKIEILSMGFIVSVSTLFLGALFEVGEYLGDGLFGFNHSGDGADTLDDLFLDIVGAFLAIGFIILYSKLQKFLKDP